MATAFIDGFDHYAIADMGDKWPTVTDGDSSLAMDTATPITGVQSLKMQLSDSMTFNLWKDEHAATPVGTIKAGAGLAVKLPGNPASALTLIKAIWTNPTAQTYELKTDASGQLLLYLGGVLKFTYSTYNDSTSFDLTDGAAYYIEVTFTNVTAAGTPQFRLHLNNKLVANVTTGTEEAAGNALVAVSIHATINDQLVDNLYIFNNGFADFAGAPKVHTLFPDSAGNFFEWTRSDTGAAHWALVDDPLPDDDATFVQAASGLNRLDSYGMDDPPAGPEPDWAALQMSVYVKNLIAGTSAIIKGFVVTPPVYLEVPQHPAGTFDYDVLADTTYTFVRWMGLASMSHSLETLANLDFGLEAA